MLFWTRKVAGYQTSFFRQIWMRFKVGTNLSEEPSYKGWSPEQKILLTLAFSHISGWRWECARAGGGTGTAGGSCLSGRGICWSPLAWSAAIARCVRAKSSALSMSWKTSAVESTADAALGRNYVCSAAGVSITPVRSRGDMVSDRIP